ncbi:MAG: hypothetical protein EGMGGAKC_00969 [Dehalococcoides mccartyi]|nr:hypothetical protein [Dehalococcoides mccartyi]
MSLVKGITGKGLNQGKHLFGYFRGIAVFQSPVNKIGFLFLHNGRNLLAHGLAEYIRLSQGIAGEGLGYKQHLLLVNNNTVSFFQYGFKGGVGVGDRLKPVLGFDKTGYLFHRAGAVQSHHSAYV